MYIVDVECQVLQKRATQNQRAVLALAAEAIPCRISYRSTIKTRQLGEYERLQAGV